jgi:hypothetical protein
MKFKDLFFIHIPKTGGTFVTKNLKGINYAKKFRYPTHSTYSDCKYLCENKIIFTVVRNPYLWLESWFYFGIERNNDIKKYKSFNKFITNEGFLNLNGGLRQYEYINLKMPTEHILKTENLNEDLKKFLNLHNIKFNINEERIRENTKKPNNIFWSKEMKRIVNDYYSKDFKIFNYDFK